MNFDEYQAESREFAIYRDATYPFLGLAEETGEFLGIAAKTVRGDDMVARFGSQAELREATLKEAGDILWQLAQCLTELGLSLQDAANLNLDKLLDRKSRGVIQGSGDNR